MQLLKKYSANTFGKDYICSDIHGHFDLLDLTLSTVSFDDTKDRLFCLGDLIDRGDDSHRSLEYLAKPWFFSIQGNHERMLINVHEKQLDTLRFQWFSWGGAWAEDLSDEEIAGYYFEFCKLPIAIEIEISDGRRIGLVHAELPDVCDWDDVKVTLKDTAPEFAEHNLLVSDMLWKKNQPYYSESDKAKIEKVANIHHVFHGHTIVDRIMSVSNRTFMDLGSYKTGKIGLIDVEDFLLKTP